MASFFSDRECVDPLRLAAWCARQDPPVPTDRWAAKVNSFSTGPGAKPGRGWILLKKADLDGLSLTSDQTLAFSGEDADHVVTFSPVTLLDRECLTPGSSTDANSVYLCEVADRRHLLGLIPLDAGYNLRTADGTGYQTQTLNSGVAWTWQQLVQDIATALGIGTLTLPFTPDATPENFQFWGSPSALACLCDVLTRVSCDLAYDPVANTFAVVRLGVARDTELDEIEDGRTWDGYSSEEVRGWRPEKVRVRFVRRPQPAGGGNPYYTVDVTLTAVTGVESGTVVQIDDDLSALAASGTPSNSAALATRAAERAADWLRKRQYYDRPVLRAWRDFVPDAAELGAYAVRRVVFDDRGLLQTWAQSEADDALEEWRPQGGWPAWWPPPPPPPPAFSGAHVTNSAAQSIANNTPTLVTFDGEAYDTDAYHDLATNTSRLTIPATGYYSVGGFVAFDAGGVGQRYLRLLLNGTEVAGQSSGPVGPTGVMSFPHHAQLSYENRFVAGDYLELAAAQTSGGNLNVEGGGVHSAKFWISKIGS